MQKIRAKLRFCLTESITDNPGTLDTKNSKILKKKILFIHRLGSKPWSSFILGKLGLC